MARLRAVEPGELPYEPTNLVDATERGTRRQFLVMARRTVAQQIEDGKVPAHALGRLIAELDRLDTEVRRLDALDQEEAGSDVTRGYVPFDASAI